MRDPSGHEVQYDPGEPPEDDEPAARTDDARVRDPEWVELARELIGGAMGEYYTIKRTSLLAMLDELSRLHAVTAISNVRRLDPDEEAAALERFREMEGE